MLAERIAALKRELTGFGGHVERMVEKSVEALLRKEADVLVEVRDRDEEKANEWEIELDELCTAVIAQYQPKAKDLRTVLMVLKMNSDLERMGDHAVNIAESGLYLIERPAVKPLLDIPRMVGEVVSMMRDSVSSFIHEDPVLAQNVCQRDSLVDALAEQVFRELVTYMTDDSTTIERALHLLKIAGNLERVADLSTNIGEDVIFMVEGRVIKHHHEEKESTFR